jgi:hypothetical protein
VAVPHLQGRGGQQGRVKGGGTDMSRDLQPPMANPDGRTAATGRETHVICVKAENSCVQEAMGGGGGRKGGRGQESRRKRAARWQRRQRAWQTGDTRLTEAGAQRRATAAQVHSAFCGIGSARIAPAVARGEQSIPSTRCSACCCPRRLF